MFAKTNFLFFYLRLFSDERFRRLTWAIIWTCILSAISFLVATSVKCWPISYTWTKWDGEHQGHCHDINIQTWVHASVNIILDIVVVSLPISQIVRLNWRWKQKLGAGMMFAVALLITLVSILRLKTIKSFMKTSNPTWDIVPISNWSFVELNGFIFCSCMPAFRNYFRRIFRRRRGDLPLGNRGRLRTVVDRTIQPGGQLYEIVSVDVDQDGGSDHSLQELSQIDLGVGHLPTNVLAMESDRGASQTSATEHADHDKNSAEMDLTDLYHLSSLIFESVQENAGTPRRNYANNQEAEKERKSRG
ncbi:CFEM domain-containing protein [Colletotrichum higginsianum IMI 349063]|uniref:CFEM domain-containing protein n=1 Tax=Colletotrichum higginsianum (strain IMI 349063) TaxID=759273 RepID=A0A1B7YH40_COLHI|nr:CFEM domain-containing protein [Colletotrichum higginsianum IMI 349063]OBR11376.1 CFEM domain-containing protein [Colletotrichum higginsianum IMI 349063]